MAEADRQRQFEQLYSEHFDRVASYLLARSDREFADDGLARTFEIAWRRMSDVPEDPLPWLLGVARRVLSDFRRTQRGQDALVERIAGTAAAKSSIDHAETHRRRSQLLEAIAALTSAQREALLLIAWDGLTERQAAEVMKCSRGALALRVHRARKQLRVSLADPSKETHREQEAPCEINQSNKVYPSPREAT